MQSSVGDDACSWQARFLTCHPQIRVRSQKRASSGAAPFTFHRPLSLSLFPSLAARSGAPAISKLNGTIHLSLVHMMKCIAYNQVAKDGYSGSRLDQSCLAMALTYQIFNRSLTSVSYKRKFTSELRGARVSRLCTHSFHRKSGVTTGLYNLCLAPPLLLLLLLEAALLCGLKARRSLSDPVLDAEVIMGPLKSLK